MSIHSGGEAVLVFVPSSAPPIPPSNQGIPFLRPPPRRANPIDTAFLILAQPRLARLAQDALAHEIYDQATDDADESDGIHPMDVQAEDAHADDDAPEVAREQADVEEGGRREPEHERRQRVEEREAQRVADQIPADATVPDRDAERVAVEDARLRAVDQHAPEAELADDFVQGPLADEEFLGDVAHAIEGGADEGEEVTFELVAARDGAVICGAGDVVAGQQDAHAADADQDAGDLRGVVAHVQEEEGEHDDEDDGPEVNQLRR